MSAARILFKLAGAAKFVAVAASEYLPTVDYNAFLRGAYTFVEDTDLSFRLAATSAAAAPVADAQCIVGEGYDSYRLMFMFCAALGAYGGYQYQQYLKRKEDAAAAAYLAEEKEAEAQRVAVHAQADAVRRLGAQDQVDADYVLARQLAEDSDSDEASNDSSSDEESSSDDDVDQNNDQVEDVVPSNFFAQRLEAVGGEVPTVYKCILTLEIMMNPVAADDGKIYEKAALKDFFASREAKQLPIVSPVNAELKMGKNMMQLGAFKSQIEDFVRTKELSYLSEVIPSLRSMFFRDANGEPADEKSAVTKAKADEAVNLITEYIVLRR